MLILLNLGGNFLLLLVPLGQSFQSQTRWSIVTWARSTHFRLAVAAQEVQTVKGQRLTSSVKKKKKKTLTKKTQQARHYTS